MSDTSHSTPKWFILPIIVIAQFCGTSLWFAGNAVLQELQQHFQLADQVMGYITSSVQFGFIIGTLVFALLLIADRFSAPKVFLVSALLGALFNFCIHLFAQGLWSILIFRFLTGFFLAGIYPVGMKIAAEWFPKGLGLALGYLVGALVLGTAFPHLLRYYAAELSWGEILIATSIIASIGGLLLWAFVGDGPHRKKATRLDLRVLPKIFSDPKFKAAALGYFGHMWELYTFWAFVPFLLMSYQSQFEGMDSLSIPLLSFIAIAMGALGCVIGGYLSKSWGSRKVAFYMLLTSGLCCLLLPLFFGMGFSFFFTLILIWGFSVVGDSPQFSSLVAQSAPKAYVGSALTIVNGIGFGITILSIELFNFCRPYFSDPFYFWLLLIGPIVGLFSIRSKRQFGS